MKNTLKYIGILLLAMVLFTNCQKDNKGNDAKDPGEVSFAVLDGNMDKSDVFDIECIEGVEAVKARINLNGNFYYPELFVLDGVLYTQSLKLDPGDYTIMEFSLLSEDDVVLKSTPMADSHYAQFLTDGYAIGDLPPFTIYPFEKNQFDVEVLCYIEAAFDGFGFEWFDITEITVREQCFFGDFCIKDENQYVGSLYDDNGITIDEVAIFKIVLTDLYSDEPPLEFYNYNNGEYTSPLCVEYADYMNATDEYKFELYIYVTSGDGWAYVKFYEWIIVDDQMIPAGEDGVVDFVLGNCVMDTPDLLLPPWMNLPSGSAFDFNLSNGGLSGDAYWDITIGGITSSKWDLQNGTYKGWCADEGTTIGNGNHCMNAISSLYPDNLPDYWFDETPAGGLTKSEAICATNWLWNAAMAGDYPGYTTTEMQNALWNLFNNKTVTGTALDMANDAKMHTNFSPLPGGWAAIFFEPCTDTQLQMTFLIVDP
jgi:hypothetical protein